jgi:hypothetical protein
MTECYHDKLNTQAPDNMKIENIISLSRDGYCVFENVYSLENVRQLRCRIEEHFEGNGVFGYGGKYQLRGMNVIGDMCKLLITKKLIDVIKYCTYPLPPLITGECDFMIDTTSGWHKDITADMKLEDRIYPDKEFSVYKLAIYLQDQNETSKEVLKVRPGAHRFPELESLPARPVPVRAGDVIVFDVRLDHAGRLATVVEKLLRKGCFEISRVFGANPEKWFTNARKMLNTLNIVHRHRLGVFLTFGPCNSNTYLYERAGRHRHGDLPAPLHSDLLEKLSFYQVGIIQPDLSAGRAVAGARQT